MRTTRKSYRHNIPAARNLRLEQTPSEQALWEALRGGRLDGMKFRRQHAVNAYVLDFYCDDYRLAVEVDGGIHLDPEQGERDQERQKLLEEQDVEFVRVSNQDVLDRLPFVLTLITDRARARGSYISTSPRTTPLSRSVGRGAGGEG